MHTIETVCAPIAVKRITQVCYSATDTWGVVSTVVRLVVDSLKIRGIKDGKKAVG